MAQQKIISRLKALATTLFVIGFVGLVSIAWAIATGANTNATDMCAFRHWGICAGR